MYAKLFVVFINVCMNLFHVWSVSKSHKLTKKYGDIKNELSEDNEFLESGREHDATVSKIAKVLTILLGYCSAFTILSNVLYGFYDKNSLFTVFVLISSIVSTITVYTSYSRIDLVFLADEYGLYEYMVDYDYDVKSYGKPQVDEFIKVIRFSTIAFILSVVVLLVIVLGG